MDRTFFYFLILKISKLDHLCDHSENCYKKSSYKTLNKIKFGTFSVLKIDEKLRTKPV